MLPMPSLAFVDALQHQRIHSIHLWCFGAITTKHVIVPITTKQTKLLVLNKGHKQTRPVRIESCSIAAGDVCSYV